MKIWKRNLIFIWLAQFISIMSFALGMPFAPYYFQELGVTGEKELKLWVALFTAATPFALAIAAPIWGMLSDRYGRKIMLMRSHLAAAVVLTLMGTARSPLTLVLLRLAQGFFTGTLTASQTMVASSVPIHRSGMALGALSAAVFSGITIGAGAGGVLAHHFGYHIPFFLGGASFVVSSLLIWFGVQDEFTRPPEEDRPATAVADGRRRLRRAVLPLLGLFFMMAFSRQFETPFFPLLVQEMHGRLEGASLWAGGLIALGGVAGFLSGFLVGRIADRVDPGRLSWMLVAGAMLFLIPHAFVQDLRWLLPLRFGLFFCAGGLDPVLQTWLTRVIPKGRHGVVFGWTASARALGWMSCPLASGWVAASWGTRSLYPVGAGIYLVFMLWIMASTRKRLDSPSLTRNRNPQ